jgi:hypothetical protein
MKSLLVVVMGLLLIGSVASAADIITDSATGPGTPVSPDARAECGTYHLSQNIEPNVFTGGTLTCGNVTLNYVTEGWALRRMNLYWEFGIDEPFIVECVSWGVRRFSALPDSIPGPYNVDVNLYTIPAGFPFVFANLTPLASRPEAITTADNPVPPAIGVWKSTIFDTPFDSFHGDLDLVVAIHYPETYSLAPAVRFAPSTASSLGETAASYVAFADCGYPEPVTPADLGNPDAMFLVVLEGRVPVGACCGWNYSWCDCRFVSLSDCEANPGGVFQGENVPCVPSPCCSFEPYMVAFGLNDDGQVNPAVPPTGLIGVEAGYRHSLGIKSDGTIVAWGYNFHGQCTVPSPNAGFVAAAGGYGHSLGLKSDGTIVAWGDNAYGQCNVPSPNAGFQAVAAGLLHNIALKSDGTIVAWGDNGYGECNVPSPNAGFVAIATRGQHNLGLKSDGTIVAWGRNTDGQCNIPSPNAGFVGVATGWGHSLGLKSDGTIVAWGRNDYGQCNIPSPNADFVAAAGGEAHTLGLKSDGTIVAWGRNQYGQCDVPLPNAGFITIAVGGYHSLGLRRLDPAGVDDPVPQVPSGAERLRILSVMPNPITSSAEIFFEARESGPVNMTVHDVEGRRVMTTSLGSFQPGRHQVRWVARDAAGLRLPSGVYFLRLQGVAGKPSAVRVLLIR